MKRLVTIVEPNGNVRKKEMEVKDRKGGLLFIDTKYMNIGYYLLSPLLLGVAAGLGLDHLFRTKPVFTLVFIVLGMVSAFYNLYKIIKNA